MNERQRVDRLLDRGRFAAARKRLRALLGDDPGDHWLMARVGATYVDQGKYTAALAWIRRALRIKPKCPIALWHLAYVHYGRRRYSHASRVLRTLIRRRIRSYVSAGECSQSAAWARSHITDCYLVLALSEQNMRRHKASARAYRQHLRRRKKGWRGALPLPLWQARANLKVQDELGKSGRR